MSVPNNQVELFLCGDVMTGRGIDQALPHSVDPGLHEQYIRDARDYLSLVHRRGGKRIDTPVSYDWIWGDALEVWRDRKPAVKIINLETSITTENEPWQGKGIHYRMHPENVRLFTLPGIDVCCLANNHILDWGRKGLHQTLESLHTAGLKTAGAGKNNQAARRAAVVEWKESNIVVLSAGHSSSGVPPSWAATEERSGLYYLDRLDDQCIAETKAQVKRLKAPHPIVVFSIHWGSNWGYDIPKEHRSFAYRLIDEAGVDIVYGHSSHHPRGFEVYNDRLIIYGAGDFINDYEGISGHEKYRDDLVFMYFPSIDSEDGTLESLDLVPMRIRQFSLHHANEEESKWLYRLIRRESRHPGFAFRLSEEGTIQLRKSK